MQQYASENGLPPATGESSTSGTGKNLKPSQCSKSITTIDKINPDTLGGSIACHETLRLQQQSDIGQSAKVLNQDASGNYQSFPCTPSAEVELRNHTATDT